MLADANEPWRLASQKRILVSVAVVGGNAVAEAILDVKIGDKHVATIRNTQGGASKYPNRDDEIMIGRFVPAGSPVQLIVRTVGSVNVLVYQFRFKAWKTIRRRRRFYRRRTS